METEALSCSQPPGMVDLVFGFILLFLSLFLLYGLSIFLVYFIIIILFTLMSV